LVLERTLLRIELVVVAEVVVVVAEEARAVEEVVQ
jgi:hypothetical protein